MKISTKGRYAMRLLIDLNENQGDGFVALKDIAQRQSISKKYLEQIVPALTAEGVLKASRGFQGGAESQASATLSVFKNLGRRFPAKTFSSTIVNKIDNIIYSLLRNCTKIETFRKEET